MIERRARKHKLQQAARVGPLGESQLLVAAVIIDLFDSRQFEQSLRLGDFEPNRVVAV